MGWRAHRKRTEIKQMIGAVIVIQKNWRRHRNLQIHSTKLKAAIKAATLIQAHWRGFQQKTKFMRLKLACIVIQMRVRQYLSRVNNHVNEEMICAALIIQKAWRGQKQ